MPVRVQREDFDIGREVAKLTCDSGKATGGIVTFTGTVRGGGEPPLVAMTLEHYPGMTEAELERIEAEARTRWPLTGSLLIHRHGRLLPGDNIVLVVTASQHREAAFEAARFLMDYLKTRAPFWKQEELADGTCRWVEAKVNDDEAARRW